MQLMTENSMKIAFIVNEFPALTETFILNQVTGLLDAGHDVQIYAHSVNKESGVHPAIQSYSLMDRVHCLAYPWNKFLRPLRAIGLFLRNFTRDPARILHALNIFQYGVSALSLKRFYYLLPFLQTDHDIIHCHLGTNGPIGVQLKEMGVKGKLVTTFYGLDMSALPKIEKWRIAYDRLFSKGDLFLVEGGHMREGLIRIGCPPQKAKIQHIMVDYKQISSKERGVKGVDEKFVMLHCGRFVEKKGLVYALKALEILLDQHPQLELRVIGDGELRHEIEEFIRAHNLEKHVVLLGYQPHAVFVQESGRADILLQPSVTALNGDSEGGAPTVLLEAQASGLPVVATYHADIPEVVKDGGSGFLVKERDVSGLAEKIERLIQDPALRLAMGRKGRQHIEQEYSITSEIEKLESHYCQVLREKDSSLCALPPVVGETLAGR